ncbi:protein of unknown function [Saccharopolyspora antimicrobica]|uniref:Uncharacterized protein DUF3817 n=1 Tax=Saccharopolyspora antimicrobica TaxID=455193 RepID=A0A1I5IPN8_9PSEU|nr:DUF3817 domain-containing protein [Saccharopolyspora antimicrobica]RKT84083.1 uncharacterized protein DUF3817 [Saccharopolyspora antimicrobica]SFO62270.1 protein of unknown function [Saccharopolyspora antimicrobica]
MRALRIAAAAEAASLALLLINLFTVHIGGVSSLVGPLHGMAYLVVIAATFLVPAPPAARWLALIPGIGGLLALRRLRDH